MNKDEVLSYLEQYCVSPTTKSSTMSSSYSRITKLYVKQFLNTFPHVLPNGNELKIEIKRFIAHGKRKASTNRVIATTLCLFLTDIYLLTKEDAKEIIRKYPSSQIDWSVKSLSVEQQVELLTALRNRGSKQFSRIRDYCITVIMLLTGIRVSQVIQISNWNITDDVFTFDVKRQKNIHKTIRRKEIPLKVKLPDGTLFKDVITLYLSKRPDSLYLFPTKDGGMLSTQYLRYFFNKNSLLGIHIHPHMLRHTAGTTIAENVSVPAAAAVLDHANIVTTMRYIKQADSTSDIILKAWNSGK
ncbi:MAG: site-specific integrase [Bacteriodetes bacterium]|nr:site-specific integrase [Bacteroidota bacterium]